MKKYTITLQGINVEVLGGRSLVYCWPSSTSKGKYVVISERNFLNTRPEDLPELPEIFRRPQEPEQEKPEPRATTRCTRLSPEEQERSIEYYRTKDFGTGTRHDDALKFSRCLFGLGVSGKRLEDEIRDYIESRGRALTDPGEAKRIAERAEKLDAEPAVPWRKIMEERRLRRSIRRSWE